MTFKSLCRLSSNNPYGVKSLARATVEQWKKMFAATIPPITKQLCGMIETSEKKEEDCNWAVEMGHQVSDLSRTVRHKHQLSLLPKLCKHVDFQHPAVGSQSWHSRGKHCWQHQQSPLPQISWRLLGDKEDLGPQSCCFEAVYIEHSEGRIYSVSCNKSMSKQCEMYASLHRWGHYHKLFDCTV